ARIVDPTAAAVDVATPGAAVGAAVADAATTAPTPAAPTPAPQATIVVQRGDSPWSLAETHLGDGLRWRELWDLNASRAQPGGRTWSAPDAPIQPGWELA